MTKTFTVVLLAGLGMASVAFAHGSGGQGGQGGHGGQGGPNGHGKRFELMDQNKDGKVTKEEMTAGMKAHLQQRFEKLDTNGDGALTQEEMKSGHHGHCGGEHDGKPQQ